MSGGVEVVRQAYWYRDDVDAVIFVIIGESYGTTK